MYEASNAGKVYRHDATHWKGWQMRYKALFAVGFVVGWIAGARAGRERYEQLVKYGRQVADHPAVQKATSTVTTKTTELAKTAAAKAPDFAKTAGAQVPKIVTSAKQQTVDKLPPRFGGKGGTADGADEAAAEGQLSYPADGSQASVNGAPYTTGDLVEVLAQQQGAAGVAELGQGLGLDLPDPLPGDAELLADLFQGPRVPVGQPEPQLDDPLLAVRQLAKHALQLVLQHDERRCLDRHHGVRVFDEVAEIGLLLADR